MGGVHIKTNQFKKSQIPPHLLKYFKLHKKASSWILRNSIIWHKQNSLPSSAKDRLNNTYEFVFHLVKSKKYYYDLDAIREPHKIASLKRSKYGFDALPRAWKENATPVSGGKDVNIDCHQAGKNPGDIMRGWGADKNLDYHGDGKHNPKGQNPSDIKRNIIDSFKKEPKGRNPGDIIKHDAAVGRIGNFSYNDPLHTKEYHPGGKNPGDTVESWNWRAGMDRDESEIIEVRINMPTQKEFVNYLKTMIKGFEKKLDGVFTKTKWRHWVRYDESGFAFPSVADWNMLKKILSLDDTFDLTQTETKYNAVYSSPKGKCPGDFWDITTQPFIGYNSDLEHFAVFPEELVIKPIKASTPPGGVVLDPFCGRGTVGRVAKQLGLNYVMFDINPKYCELAQLYINGQKRKLIKHQQKL